MNHAIPEFSVLNRTPAFTTTSNTSPEVPGIHQSCLKVQNRKPMNAALTLNHVNAEMPSSTLSLPTDQFSHSQHVPVNKPPQPPDPGEDSLDTVVTET